MGFGTKTKTSQSGTNDIFSQNNLLTSDQAPGFNDFVGNYFNQFSNTGNVAPANNYQYAAANNQQGVADPSQLGTAFNAANTVATNGINPATIQNFMSPYISSVVNPTLAAQNQQNQQAISNIRGQAGKQGALGNNTGQVAAYLAGVQPAQQAAIGSLYNQGFGQALGAAGQSTGMQLQGAGTAGQLTGAASGANTSLGQIGELIRRAGLSGYDLLSQGAQGLSGIGNIFGTTAHGNTTGQGTSNTQPGFGNVLAGLAGTAFSLFSDERLKSNVRRVGETDPDETGVRLPIYAYSMGDGPTQMGLMAQDVEQVRPEAVGESQGFKTVNYDKATGGDEGEEMMKPYNAGGRVGMASGGGFHDKVKTAFSALKEMREGGRVGKADGGGMFGLPSLFNSYDNVADPNGGKPTYTATPGLLGIDRNKNMASAGNSLTAFNNSIGGMGDQPQRDPFATLNQQQSSLSSMMGSMMNTGRSEGGRVGYDAGGSPAHAFAGDPTRALQAFFNAEDASLLDDYKLGNDVPMVPFGPPVPTPSDPPPIGGWSRAPHTPPTPGGITTATGDVIPLGDLGFGSLHSAQGLEAFVPPRNITPHLGSELGQPPPEGNMVGVGDTGPGRSTADVVGQMTSNEDPRATRANIPAHVSAVGKTPAPNWWARNMPEWLPQPLTGGMWEGQDPTALQMLGLGLMGMGGPMVTGPMATNLLQVLDQRRQQRALESNLSQQQSQLALSRDTLTEQGRHNREIELIRRQDRPETAFQTAIATRSAADLEQRATAVRESQGRLAQIEQLGNLLANPNVYQGPGGEHVLALRRAAAALGFNMEGVPESETAQAIANRLALGLRSTAGGEGMPGAMSDADRVFLLQSIPSLARTRDGNALMIRLFRESEQYKVAANAEAMRFIQANRSNVGLGEHMTAWMATNPMSRVVPTHAQTREQITAASAPQPSTGAGHVGDANLPTMTAAEAQAAGVTRFRGTDGRIYGRPPTPDVAPDGAPWYTN